MRLAAAVAFLVAAATARSLALPGGAAACSCVLDPGQAAFTGEEDAVFVGTAGAPQPDGTYVFAVETWFKGGGAANVRVASERVVFADGSSAINTCGLHFEVGDRLIMAAALVEGLLTPGTCSPHAVIGTAEAGLLFDSARARFGEGRPPGGDTVTDATGADLATLALGIMGAVVVIGVLVVAVALRRGRGQRIAP